MRMIYNHKWYCNVIVFHLLVATNPTVVPQHTVSNPFWKFLQRGSDGRRRSNVDNQQPESKLA